MLAFDSKAQELFMVDFSRLDFFSLFRLEDGALGNATHSVLEFPELHSDRGSGSGLAGIVPDGLGMPQAPVHNVQLQPRGSIFLVSAVSVTDGAEEFINTLACTVFRLEGFVSCDFALHIKPFACLCIASIALLLKGLIVNVCRLAILLAGVDLQEAPMDEVSLYNTPANLLHESSIVVVPNMHNTANQVLPMCFDRDVGSVVSLIIASLVTGPEEVLVNLLLRDMTLNLRDAYCLGAFGPCSFLEMVPQVPIRGSLPVIFVAFARF